MISIRSQRLQRQDSNYLLLDPKVSTAGYVVIVITLTLCYVVLLVRHALALSRNVIALYGY
jgi:hypothetical protein